MVDRVLKTTLISVPFWKIDLNNSKKENLTVFCSGNFYIDQPYFEKFKSNK